MDNFKEIIEKIPEEEREEFLYLCLDYRQAVWEQNQANLAGRIIPHHKFALHRAEYHNRIMDILRRILGKILQPETESEN